MKAKHNQEARQDMVGTSIRRIQVVSFALSHIPLAAVATVLLRDGSDGDWGLIGLTFVATAVTAAVLLTYLDRAVKAIAAQADRSENKGPATAR